MRRTLKQALKNAERLRREIHHLVQPSATDYDMIRLADRVYELEKMFKERPVVLIDRNCPM